CWGLYMYDQCRATIDVAERYADGLARPEELEDGFGASFRLRPSTGGRRERFRPDPYAVVAASPANKDAYDAATTAAWDGAFDRQTYRPRASEFGYQAAVARDIFGNLFRPVVFDPNWRSADVVGLARGIYVERAFDRLPLLADALMDAGCADEQI